MTTSKVVPVDYRRDFYNNWCFVFQCINLHRKHLADYWYNQARKLAEAQNACLNGDDLKPVTDDLCSRFLDRYYYYMTCPAVQIAREANINLEFGNLGCYAAPCTYCAGSGYIENKQAICWHCRGYGKNIDWVFKKRDNPGKISLALVFTTKKGGITRIIEIGEKFFSVL